MVLTALTLADILTQTKARLGTIMTYGSIGTATPAASASDTALGNEVFRDSRDDFDDSVSNAVTVSLKIAITEANGNKLTEFGWFNASTGGSLWTRNVLTGITKTNDIQVYFDTTITISVVED